MNQSPFNGRHDDKIQGTLSCFDRVMIRGTLPECCHSRAMEAQMYRRNLRYFDYPDFVRPLRDEVRANAEKLAAKHDLKIQFVRSNAVRKDDIAANALSQRPDAHGLVCILSAMEGCRKFRPWHDKKTHRTHLKCENGLCLHYYFYINDPDLGLCCLRVPTWSPFSLQFYFNGHSWLAQQLKKREIEFEMADNSFAWICDFKKAQSIAQRFDAKRLHQKLDRWAKQFCPCANREFGAYHWSLWQIEFATDIAFKDAKSLQPIYHEISRTAACELKADSFATFLGRSLKNYQGEAGSRFKTRKEGTVIRHHMGPAAIKMYDKLGQVLRIETVLNDVGFLKTFREVMHRDGSSSLANAPVKKSIYSLRDLQRLMLAANKRYLTFLSSLEERSVELAVLTKLTQPVRGRNMRPYRGLNFFNKDDKSLLLTLQRGEYRLNGLTNRQLRFHLRGWSSSKVSRMLKRLRLLGIIKKVGRSYKYYLTKFGERVLQAASKLVSRVIVPALA